MARGDMVTLVIELGSLGELLEAVVGLIKVLILMFLYNTHTITVRVSMNIHRVFHILMKGRAHNVLSQSIGQTQPAAAELKDSWRGNTNQDRNGTKRRCFLGRPILLLKPETGRILGAKNASCFHILCNLSFQLQKPRCRTHTNEDCK